MPTPALPGSGTLKLPIQPTEMPSERYLAMKHVPKPTTDEDLIQEFLNKGGTIKKGKTKPMPDDLGLSNNQWGNKLTKEERAAVKAGEEERKAAKGKKP